VADFGQYPKTGLANTRQRLADTSCPDHLPRFRVEKLTSLG